LLLIDVMRMRFRTVQIQRDPSCPACGTGEITELLDYDAFCGVTPSSAQSPDDGVREITPRDLAARRARGDDLLLIDVREPAEWALARIDGARLIPLATLPAVTPTIDRSREIVIHCHHGVRSEAAVRYLRSEGFERIWNLAGGIARWSTDVDPLVPQY
jgi:adenylyltransferase/sulfurtransferase